MPFAQRVWSLVGITVIAIAATLFVPAIPQDPAYHLFADARPFLGIPNFGNVASNVAFTLVGFFGLMVLYGQTPGSAGVTLSATLPYAIFFAGVALIGAGSAYYHWAPTNATLFWDRFPMTIAFMGLFVALLSENVDRRLARVLLVPALAFGLASVLYWYWADDLRLYYSAQLVPLLTIPAVLALFVGRQTHRWLLGAGLGWYVLAKTTEYYDEAVYQLSGENLSGHSLKHLLAAVGCYCLLAMIEQRRPISS